MIPRAVCVLLSMVLGAETLPFSNMNLRPARVNQTDPNFHRPHTALYPLLALPVRHSPRMFLSGHPHLPNHQPALLSSNLFNRIEQKFDGFIPSRSKIPSSFSFHQYLSDIRQQTAQKVEPFRQRVKNTVRKYEKRRDQRMQQVKKMLHHKFKLEDTMDRMKQTLLDKEAFMNTPDWIGWRGKFVGVPYNTMNEDHMIVKKPGVDLGPLSQPDIEIPNLVPGPAAQPIATQHPVLPEMTTSVDLHQESKVPAATAGYMFPITRTTYIPEVIDTTEITNYIEENGSTRPQLPAETLDKTDASISTMSSTDPATESTILDTSVTRIPHETIFTTVNVFSEIIGGLTVGHEVTTEFGSNIHSTPLMDTRLQTEATSLAPSTSQSITTIDVLSGNPGSPITSLVIDVESTTDNISPTFPSTTTIMDNGFANSINYTGTRIAEVVSTTPSTLSTNTTFGMVGTSSLSPALETSTVAPGVFTTMDSGVTSPPIASESTSDVIFTFPYEISTETTLWPEPDSGITPLGYNQIRSYIDPVETTTEVDSTLSREIPTQTTATSEVIYAGTGSSIDFTIINEETTTEVVSTFSSTAPTETVETSAPEITRLLNLVTRFQYNSFVLPEISTRVGSTVLSSLPTETTTMVTERLTTVDRPFDHSTIDVEKTTEVVPTLSSMILNETTAAWVEMSSTPGSTYDNSTNDEKTTVEMVLTYFSGIPTETTTMVPERLTYEDLELNNSAVDIGSTTENDSILLSTISNVVSTPLEGISRSTTPISLFDSTTVEATTTAEVISTLSSAVSTETTTMVTERLTTVDRPFDHSTIDVEKTTEVVPTLSSMILNETTAAWVEMSSTPGSPYDNSTNVEKTTAEMMFTYFSGTPTETTTMVPKGLTYDDLELNNSAIDIGTTTENDSILLSTISNVASTPLEGISMTPISLFDSTTVEANTTDEVISTRSSAVLTETTTMVPERLTYQDLELNNSAIDIETTIENDSTLLSTISNVVSTPLEEISTTPISPFDSTTVEAITTDEVISTLSSTVSTETTAMVTERLTTVDRPFNHSTNDVEKTTKIVPTLSSMILNETTAAWVEMSSTLASPYDNSTNDEKTTAEMVLTYFSGTPTETTTMVPERLTYEDLESNNSAIDIGRTIEIDSILLSTISNVVSTPLEGISRSTIPVSSFDSTTVDATTTDEVISTLSSAVSTETTGPPKTTTLLDELLRYRDVHFTSLAIQAEGTTGADSILSSTTPTEATTMTTQELTIVDGAFTHSTIEMNKITNIVPTLPSMDPNETTTTWMEVFTTDSPFDNSTNDEKTTNAVVLTLSSINPTELTTRVPERLTAIDLSDGDPTIERYVTTEQIGTMFPFAISNETTPNLGEISTTTNSLFDSSIIDEKTSMEVTPMVFPTVLTEITKTSEITTLVDLLKRFQDHVSTGSTTPGVDLTSSPITPKEKTTVVPESLTNIDIAFEYLTIDMKGTTEIVSMLPSTASTDTTTTLEGISTTTSSPFDSSMIDEETTMELAPIFTSTVHTDGEATTSLEEIPTEPEAYSSTVDGKTTMEIVSTSSAVTSTEEADASTQKNYIETKQNIQDLEGTPDNTDRRSGRMLYEDSDPLPPWFARAIEEKLDEQTLPSLIPLIIEELRKNKVTPRDKHTLSQFFGDIWPLLLEESKRKQGQLMNRNLAILLSEPGQQL